MTQTIQWNRKPTMITHDPKWSSSMWRNARLLPRRRLAQVWITGRPFGNGGTILEDMVWRRSPPEISAHQIRKSGLLKELEALTGVPSGSMSVRFNRYLGCSMCPCSPGFEIVAKDGHTAPLFSKTFTPLLFPQEILTSRSHYNPKTGRREYQSVVETTTYTTSLVPTKQGSTAWDSTKWGEFSFTLGYKADADDVEVKA